MSPRGILNDYIDFCTLWESVTDFLRPGGDSGVQEKEMASVSKVPELDCSRIFRCVQQAAGAAFFL